MVRARVPEKQGLKLSPLTEVEYRDRVRARVPEKQGLKPGRVDLEPTEGTGVRARVPEKQGLKLLRRDAGAGRREVRARVPEKQGLKLSVEYLSLSLTEVRGRFT